MIHLNIGSNLDSNFGSKFDNISIAINLLIEKKFEIKKISNFYETPSYPNKRQPNFLNVGIFGKFSKKRLDYTYVDPRFFRIHNQIISIL